MKNIRTLFAVALVAFAVSLAPAKPSSVVTSPCPPKAVQMCLGGKTMCVATYLVPTLRRLGGTVGPCNAAQ